MLPRILQLQGLLITGLFVLGSAHAATLAVNSLADTTADDGACTLREAITSANTDAPSGGSAGECAAGSGDDIITFNLAGTIQPDSQLPTITKTLHIDGYSAPGASKNTLPLAQGTNAVLVVEIDGVNAGNVLGLDLTGVNAAGSIIEGLVINNSGNPTCCNQAGIYLNQVTGASPVLIRGNFIGTNLNGTQIHSKGSAGISINNSSNVVVGSDTSDAVDPAAVNLISGNKGSGVVFYIVSNVRVRGNLIGTNAQGSSALLNLGGAMGADSVTDSWISDNVISGNNGGLVLRAISSNVHIERNRIGVNAAGTAPLPNTHAGIEISENSFSSPTTIQNVDIVDNLVAYNTCANCSAGIVIGENNSANTTQAIRLSRNLVYSNTGPEIDIGETNGSNNGLIYGVTLNDTGDPDVGANTLQNFPEITAAAGNGITALVGYSLNSEASKTFTLQFFHTSTCDVSGYGGAESYLGEIDAVTNGSGDVSGQLLLPLAAKTGFVTATATNQNNGTSEFSACFAVVDDIQFEDGFETQP